MKKINIKNYKKYQKPIIKNNVKEKIKKMYI